MKDVKARLHPTPALQKAVDEYAEENKVLMDVFNRLTKDLSKAQLEHLKDIFVACSRYELNFWEMGWALAK